MCNETLKMQPLKKLLKENIKDESRLDDHHWRVSVLKFVVSALG